MRKKKPHQLVTVRSRTSQAVIPVPRSRPLERVPETDRALSKAVRRRMVVGLWSYLLAGVVGVLVATRMTIHQARPAALGKVRAVPTVGIGPVVAALTVAVEIRTRLPEVLCLLCKVN